jgi:AraC-like DNA-binding protein
MKYIEKVIDTLIDRSLKSREVVELHYFRDLLDGEKRTAEGWMSDQNRLKSILPDNRFTVIVLEIDHHHEFVKNYSERDQKLLKYVLKSMVQEMLQEQRLENWAEWTDNRSMTCIIAHTADSDAPNSLYKNIVEWVHSNLRFTVTIGVGRDVVNADDLGVSRTTALRALRYKAAHGIDRVIDAADVAEAAPVPLRYYYALTGSIVSAYRVSVEKGRDKLRELVKAMRRDRIDQETLKQIVKDFVLQIEQELCAMSEDYQNILPSIRDEYRPEEVETIDECGDILERMTDAIYSIMENVRESRNHRVQLEEIRSFVIRNFTDPSMSLDLLGDQFELNPKYISKLFKDAFGINFAEFVIDLRIEQACKLLIGTDDPIQEIAERSGYSNSISFGRTFKNKTGLTPGEFRQRKRK